MTAGKKIITPIPEDVEKVGKIVLDAAYQVHSALGPGLPETVYETCLAHELRQRSLRVETQVGLPFVYDKIQFESGFRLDLLIEKCVIVELKAVEQANPLYAAQLLTYLKLTGIRLGYLINFNVVHLREGIRRMVL